MTEQGKRFNAGKIMMECIDPWASKELAEVLTVGARDYGKFNWMKGLSFTETIGALKRHLTELELGNDVDTKSGRLHAAHVMANAMFLTRFLLERERYRRFDDRPGVNDAPAPSRKTPLENFSVNVGRDNDETRDYRASNMEEVPF